MRNRGEEGRGRKIRARSRLRREKGSKDPETETDRHDGGSQNERLEDGR